MRSYPLLDGVFVVEGRGGGLLRPLVFELKDGVNQHQDAQRQHAGNHHGDGVDRWRDIVDGHHDVHVVQGELAVATVTLPSGALQLRLVAAHPVSQDGLGVAGLHRQLLVVKLPVLLPPVEVGVVWGDKDVLDACPHPPGSQEFNLLRG